MSRPLGYRPDRPKRIGETPDLLLRAEHLPIGVVPRAHSALHLVKSVLDQKQLGSCVLNSAMQNVRCAHVREGFSDAPLGSRLMAYLLARLKSHETMDDAGTEVRLAFEVLNKFGFCPEEFWPYSDAQTPMRLENGVWVPDSSDGLAPFQQTPNSLAFQKAFDQRTPVVYRRIQAAGSGLLSAIKQAIANDRPVSFGASVSEAFCQGDLGTLPLPPPTSGTIAGGHAQLIVAYDADVFTVLNSWGQDFAQDGAPPGCSLWSSEYITWGGHRADGSWTQATSDFWTCESVPNYSTTTGAAA